MRIFECYWVIVVIHYNYSSNVHYVYDKVNMIRVNESFIYRCIQNDTNKIVSKLKLFQRFAI